MREEGVFEDIRRYLPQYLSQDDAARLFRELERFPENIDSRLYASAFREGKQVCQGDGFRDLLVVHLPSPVAKNAPCMVFSNTCDIAPQNERLDSMRLLYAPIQNLSKYRESLLRDWPAEHHKNIEDRVTAIRKQRVSNIFFLPPRIGFMDYEGMVRFDTLQNGPVDFVADENIFDRRLFSLSDYGFYLFLLKLSIHFTRIREGVARG